MRSRRRRRARRPAETAANGSQVTGTQHVTGGSMNFFLFPLGRPTDRLPPPSFSLPLSSPYPPLLLLLLPSPRSACERGAACVPPSLRSFILGHVTPPRQQAGRQAGRQLSVNGYKYWASVGFPGEAASTSEAKQITLSCFFIYSAVDLQQLSVP